MHKEERSGTGCPKRICHPQPFPLKESCYNSLLTQWFGHDVSTSEIPGTLLNTYYDKGDIHINIEGTMVTILA